MRPRPFRPTNTCPFATGDQVIRYVQGVPMPCVVVVVIDEQKILIRADLLALGL